MNEDDIGRADDALPAADPTQTSGRSRRAFLADVAGAAGVAATGALWLGGFESTHDPRDVEPTPAGGPGKTFTAAEWTTLEAACARLLPSEGTSSPGAEDVNAIGYLDGLLALRTVKKDWPGIAKYGAAELEARAQRRHKKPFADLAHALQDEIIRAWQPVVGRGEQPGGEQWIRVMLSGILEAFLCDPVHGGNPDGIAWAWAGHRPGFPRPTQPGWQPTERRG